MLGGRHRVAGRGVHHDDAATARSRDVDVVDADARAANHSQPVRFLDDPRSDLSCRTDDEAIVVSDDATQLIFTHAGSKLELDTRGLTQDPETRLGELVGHEDTYIGHGYSYGIRPQKAGPRASSSLRKGQGGTEPGSRPVDGAQGQQHGGDSVSPLRVGVARLLGHELRHFLDAVRRLAEPKGGPKVVGQGGGRHGGIDPIGLDDRSAVPVPG